MVRRSKPTVATPRGSSFGGQHQFLLVGEQRGAAADDNQSAEAMLAVDEYDQDAARAGSQGAVNEDLVASADAHAGQRVRGHPQREGRCGPAHHLLIERGRANVVVLRMVGNDAVVSTATPARLERLFDMLSG